MTIHYRLSMGSYLNRERFCGGGDDWSGKVGKSFSSSCFYPTKMKRLFGARAEKFTNWLAFPSRAAIVSVSSQSAVPEAKLRRRR